MIKEHQVPSMVYQEILAVPEKGDESLAIRKLRAATLWFIRTRSYKDVSQTLSNVLWFFMKGGNEVDLPVLPADYNASALVTMFQSFFIGDMKLVNFVLSSCGFGMKLYDDLMDEGNYFMTVSC